MRRLDWTPAALADLDRIDAYLEREALPGIALQMLLAIRHRADRLIDFPHAGPPMRDHGFRKLRVLGSPYIIAYRIMPGSIEILRVHHERENWREAI